MVYACSKCKREFNTKNRLLKHVMNKKPCLPRDETFVILEEIQKLITKMDEFLQLDIPDTGVGNEVGNEVGSEVGNEVGSVVGSVLDEITDDSGTDDGNHLPVHTTVRTTVLLRTIDQRVKNIELCYENYVSNWTPEQKNQIERIVQEEVNPRYDLITARRT